MKVLFIHPNEYLSIGVPQGIAYLSAVLKKAGHKTDLFDFTFVKQKALSDNHNITPGNGIFIPTEYTLEDLVANDPVTTLGEAFAKKIEEFNPDLICLSVMSSNFDLGVQFLERESEKIKCPVIAGGVHPTIAPEDVLSKKVIDYICVGEGELFLLELCEKMESGEDFTHIDNLGWRDGEQIRINPLREFINLDELPPPDWHLFDKRHLFRPFMGKIHAGSFYVMSRGCYYSCSYCVNSSLRNKMKECGSYFRYQSTQKTISDLKYLNQEFGADWFKFADDSIMSFDLDYLKELSDSISKLNIMFGCSVRPETTTDEKVRLLKAMGCVAMTVGIESGNEELRKTELNRRMSNQSIKDALSIIKKHGIRISTFNMVGMPEETRENVFETIRLNREMDISACNVYIIYPYPGTPIAHKYSIPLRDADGMLINVSKVADLALSKMNPREVEGLQKTFNLYINLPEEMWPLVKIAEGEGKTESKVFDALVDYVENSIK